MATSFRVNMLKVIITVITGLMIIIPTVLGAAAPQKPSVKLGIDNIDEYMHLFAGKRVGLITNQTGVNSRLHSSIDVLYEKTNLVALYSPEHGLRGHVEAGATVGTSIDMRTGLPVYSLYGSQKKPTADMLSDVDIICFDIQDIGTRFYTYMYTMAYAMEAAREQNKTFIVLDRPNPIGGIEVEGPVLKSGLESFIGMYPIPTRHGLTIGELALLFNNEFGIGCKLEVIPMSGWQRTMYWQDTGLPWVMTSPNIPTYDTTLVYPGSGLLGATNVSEGIGTTRPFELIGASWLNAQAFADRMNERNLPGAYFRPVYFTPRFGRYNGITCGGVQIHITDHKAYKPVLTAVTLMEVAKGLGQGEFGYHSEQMFDLAVGERDLRLSDQPVEQILSRWDQEAKEFQTKSRKYYLYQ